MKKLLMIALLGATVGSVFSADDFRTRMIMNLRTNPYTGLDKLSKADESLFEKMISDAPDETAANLALHKAIELGSAMEYAPQSYKTLKEEILNAKGLGELFKIRKKIHDMYMSHNS